MELSELQRQVLIFEATWRPNSEVGRARTAVIRDRFDLSATTYQRVLAEACAHPDAARVAPAVVRRHQATSRSRPRTSRASRVAPAVV